MEKKEVEKKTGIKKFDICLMNPPFNSGGERGGEYSIESDFVNNLNKIVNKVIAIYPFARWPKREKLSKENSTSGHLVSLDIYEAHKIFDIASRFLKYVAIWYYDNTKHYDNTTITLDDKHWEIESYNNLENIQKLYREITNEYIELKSLIDKRQKLYDDLIEKNKTMVNDGHDFIYEENRFKGARRYGIDRKTKIQTKLERVKKFLKEGKYKYCLYKNSYNGVLTLKSWNGEDPDKLFNGQLCWLTNNKTVKNNIIYWMNSSLVDLWRLYYFGNGGGVNDGRLGWIPALDFEMNENDFKKYVDSLNDFNEEEVKLLKKYNINNADKL